MKVGEQVDALVTARSRELPYPATMAASARAAAVPNALRLTAGQPHRMPPSSLVEAMRYDLLTAQGHRYPPSQGLPELRAAVARTFQFETGIGCDAEQVLITSGARSGIAMIFELLLELGDQVVIPAPYWPSFPALVRRTGGTAVTVRTDISNSYKITPEQLARALNRRTKIVVLNSPNNPTGAVYSASELKSLAAVLDAHSHPLLILADEVYRSFTVNPETNIPVAAYFPNQLVATVSSWSKSHSLSGSRVGSIVSDAKLIAALARLQAQTAYPSRNAQAGALAACNESDGFSMTLREECLRNWSIAGEILHQLPPEISILTPEAPCFVFLDLSNADLPSSLKGTERKVDWLLQSYGLGVTDGGSFGSPCGLRVSLFASPEEIEAGFSRLALALTCARKKLRAA